jgi:hypothetical protein
MAGEKTVSGVARWLRLRGEWLQEVLPSRDQRLPCGNTSMVGSSRKPPIEVRDLKPGQTAEVDSYPKGHLPGVTRITAEVEELVSSKDEQFFPELTRQRYGDRPDPPRVSAVERFQETKGFGGGVAWT